MRTMTRKLCVAIIGIALALGLIIGFEPTAFAASAVWDGTADVAWYNTQDTTFTLTTAEQLAGVVYRRQPSLAMSDSP